MICPRKLKIKYKNHRVIPFIGAGLSTSIEWKKNGRSYKGLSWNQLVEKAMEMMGFKKPELLRFRGTDFQILQYFKLKNNNKINKLTKWMSSYMKPPNIALKKSEIHYELSRLKNCKIFYTTNFDDFLERALMVNGRSCHVISSESDMGGFVRDCEVVKFHGDWSRPEKIVLTESDYERRLPLSMEMDHKLWGDLYGRILLFIGYSFRDPNVSYLFRLFTDIGVQKRKSHKNPRAYIVVPNPSQFEIELFKSRNIEVIGVKDFKEDITKLLREMRS